jgi:hypothetical protein
LIAIYQQVAQSTDGSLSCGPGIQYHPQMRVTKAVRRPLGRMLNGWKGISMRCSIATLLFVLVAIAAPALAQDMPAEYAAVLKALNKPGDYKGNVLKVNVPRNDVTVAVQGVLVPTPLGFGGWIALTKGDHDIEVMMGDLVLTESEVNAVMTAVLTAGLNVTALHNHFFFDSPRMYYMHVHGIGTAAELTQKIKPALDLIGRDPFAVQAGSGTDLPKAPLNAERLSTLVGHPGEKNGDVYKITVGRPDLDLREHGARIESRMGLNTWAAFAGSDEEAVVAGDVAMLASEVTPVLKALRGAGLSVVALHHHMTTGTAVFFVHYWGRGDAATLARGVRAALDVLPKH